MTTAVAPEAAWPLAELPSCLIWMGRSSTAFISTFWRGASARHVRRSYRRVENSSAHRHERGTHGKRHLARNGLCAFQPKRRLACYGCMPRPTRLAHRSGHCPVRELLDYLSKNDVPWAVATSGRLETPDQRLRHLAFHRPCR